MARIDRSAHYRALSVATQGFLKRLVEDRQFRDVQVSDPFAGWEHTHRVEPDGSHACFLESDITYALPLGSIGRWVGGSWVRKKLDPMFAYRHRITTQDIET